MSTCVFLDAFAIPTYRLLPRISLRHVLPPVCFWGTLLLTRDIVLPPVCFWGTLLLTRDIVAWISPRAG